MSGSDVSIVAFGRPECDDAQSHVLLAASALGVIIRLVTSFEGEDFFSMDYGFIDWRGALNGAHWFVTSASTAIEGEAARFAWGAGMTFGELEGARTVMIADLPEDPSRLAESWGAVIERIRQIHVLFIDPAALGPISQLEGVNQSDLLHEIHLRGLVSHVCTLDNQREALVEHALGSARVPTRAPANPYEWLAGFICELPGSGLGQAGVERAARVAGNADSPSV